MFGVFVGVIGVILHEHCDHARRLVERAMTLGAAFDPITGLRKRKPLVSVWKRSGPRPVRSSLPRA
ncbi:MAG: hypothetical protein K9H25_14000 [Rhodospirillum sp.]|nr:hypothetical protein [Rhodospirillum sp.]MCF8490139.1 hypothetical protein [Rhodospirillum sp.]